MECAFTPTPADWQLEEEDSEEDNCLSIRKRLFDGLETPARRLSIQKQPVVVYLRVRPKSKLEIGNSDADCLHRLSASELLAVPPRNSQAYKNKSGARCLPEDNQKFFFTNIFETTVTQKEVFEETLLPTLKDFFAGQNCLVFTYGITNSGKTYTVTGTAEEPGLLPRSLDVIFNTIDEQQLSSVAIKPKNFSEVTYPSQQEQEAEQQRKEAMLAKAHEASPHASPPTDEDPADGDISTASKASSNYSKITDDGLDELTVHEDSSIELEDGNSFQYSLWVSFAEIYNEYIYDLLADAPQKGRPRPALKVSEDKNHNHFIKGLCEVQVKTVEEALLLLRLGLRGRRVAATRLNYQSSRSHSIYTIKLIKLASRDNPHVAMVNRISIVDLAGAERSSKTGATGARVKEAGNINNSLFTLGKCIEAMKHNQIKKYGDDRVIPFRESKLTKLFQNYFVGKGKGVRQGKITMVVNISNNASVFDETMHVLKFSALTSKVVPVVKLLPAVPSAPTLPPPLPTLALEPESTRRSIPWASDEDAEGREEEPGEQPARSIEEEETATVVGFDCPRCKFLRSELTHCRKDADSKISVLQVRMMEQECVIRKEVCREFGEQLTEIEEKHSRELDEQAEDLHDMYEKRVQLLQRSVKKSVSRKRRRPNDEEETEDSDLKQPSLRIEVANLKEKVQELEEELALERNRAAAEFGDASETYETRAIQFSTQLSEMSLKLAAAKKAEEELRGQIEVLQGELGAVREAMQEREAELGAVRETMQEREAELGAVREAMQEREAELGAVREAMQEREAELGAVRVAMQEREAELGAVRETMQEREAELSTEWESFKLSKSSASASESQLRDECQSLSKNLEDIRGVVVELTAENEALKNKLAAVESDSALKLEEMQTQLARLVTDKETFAREFGEVQEGESRLAAEREALAQELETLKMSSSAQLEEAKTRVAALTAEKEALAKMVKAQQGDTDAELEILQCRISELTREKSDVEISREQLQQQLQDGCSTSQEKECELGQLQGEIKSLLSQLDGGQRELISIQEEHVQELTCLREEHSKQLTSIQEEHVQELTCLREEHTTKLASIQEEHANELHATQLQQETQVAALFKQLEERQEVIEHLQGAKDASVKEVANLELQLAEFTSKNSMLSSELKNVGMLCQTLKEYEATLEDQSARLQELHGERDLLHQHNEELQEASRALNLQLERVTSTRDALKSRLTELDQKLREKEEELLSLTRASSGEHAEVAVLKGECAGLKEECAGLSRAAEELKAEHQAQVEALKGQHQLELSQLTIRVRELSDQLGEREGAWQEAQSVRAQWSEEVESLRTQWSEEVDKLHKELKAAEKKTSKLKAIEQENKTLKKSQSSLKKEIEQAKKGAEQAVKEKDSLEARVALLEAALESEELQQENRVEASEGQLPEDEAGLHQAPEVELKEEGNMAASEESDKEHIYEEPPELPDDPTIYESVTDEETGGSQGSGELDRSKPFVPLLERSSQLVEESFSQVRGAEPICIDATPAVAKKRGFKRKTRKRSIDMVVKEEVSPAPKRSKYPLRSNRKKPQRLLEDCENTPPTNKTRNIKKFTQYFTGGSKKSTPCGEATSTCNSPVRGENSPVKTAATTGRKRRLKAIRKSQISEPLELMTSPAPGRNPLDGNAKILLGRQLRPLRRGFK